MRLDLTPLVRLDVGSWSLTLVLHALWVAESSEVFRDRVAQRTEGGDPGLASKLLAALNATKPMPGRAIETVPLLEPGAVVSPNRLTSVYEDFWRPQQSQVSQTGWLFWRSWYRELRWTVCLYDRWIGNAEAARRKPTVWSVFYLSC